MSKAGRNVVVKLDGAPIAHFNTQSQAEMWLDNIATKSGCPRERYVIENAPADPPSLDGYKADVYDAVMEYASDPDCVQVQDFLALVGIDPNNYLDHQEFTVEVTMTPNSDFDKYVLTDLIQDGLDRAYTRYVKEFNVRLA